jgi:hypothetical protein
MNTTNRRSRSGSSNNRLACSHFSSTIMKARHAPADSGSHLGRDTLVDFEQSLNFCIRPIRITLNDQADRPLSIETLRGLGYRFVVPVERIGDSETAIAQKRIRTV